MTISYNIHILLFYLQKIRFDLIDFTGRFLMIVGYEKITFCGTKQAPKGACFGYIPALDLTANNML